VVILVAGVAYAEDRQSLSSECEIAVARSALPSRLRADSSVYVLQGDHFEKVVEGDGPFTCIVERNHPQSVIPQCMDKAGLDSVLPAIIDRSLMSVAGASLAEIDEENASRLLADEYAPASRPGVSYMMSAYNYTFVQSANRVLKVAPHMMFYAPNVSNADIGGSFESMSDNIGTPFVFQEGPHGYMIVYTQYPADPNEVAEACRGQLGEPPPSFNPFPKG
jgi:hypothetical protein